MTAIPIAEIAKHLGQSVTITGQVQSITIEAEDHCDECGEPEESRELENDEYRITLLVRPNGLDL